MEKGFYMEFTFSLCFAIGELLFGLVEDWSV